MSWDPISVLVVDDSAMMRSLLGRIVEAHPDLRLAGKAMNGQFALQKIETLKPEAIVLDLEMPQMNGIEFLVERRRRGITIPVVVLSSIAERGAKVTMDALALGASDFLLKPTGSEDAEIRDLAEQLTMLLRSLGTEYRVRGGTGGRHSGADAPDTAAAISRTAMPHPASPRRGSIQLVALGVSTGGPNALRKIFAQLDADLPVPIVVVQHMPPGFTEEFAKSLDRVCSLAVKEASEGDALKPGRVLICPGNRHMTVERAPHQAVVHLNDAPHRNGHRPSADVLFQSVATEYGDRAMGIIMTGMGKDGAVELGAIARRGGVTIGQDQESSVVYGMPRVAFEMGHVQEQVPLSEMANTISRIVHNGT